MSSKQKRPGTTSPMRRVTDAIDERLANLTKRSGTSKESNPNLKTGSKFGKKARGRRNPKPVLHRKPGNRQSFGEGVDMSNIVDTIRYIIENHGADPKEVLAQYHNRPMLVEAAKKCMASCLSGWERTEDGIVSENTNMILSPDSWRISDDGSVELVNGFRFDYDWLYSIAASDTIKEAVEAPMSSVDKDQFADALSNASNLLRKLSDKEVKKYILNAAKNDENVDLMALKEVLEDTGVNFKFIGAEIDGDKINLLIKVRYSKDGTQEGVMEKKLSIEVKPSADVVDRTESDISKNEVDLDFQEPPEPELEPELEPEPELDIEPEPKDDLEGGMDLGIDLK